MASRKMYRSVALSLKTALGMTDDKPVVARIARDLALDFKRENEAFRYDLFFEACGLDAFGEVIPTDEPERGEA